MESALKAQVFVFLLKILEVSKSVLSRNRGIRSSGQLQLHGEFGTNLGYVRPCLRKKKSKIEISIARI